MSYVRANLLWLIPAFIHAAAAAQTSSDPQIQWVAPLEVATGAGVRGPWRQNESRFEYVDDATVALDENGNAFVSWVDQKQKDVMLQVYGRDGKPRFSAAVNVSGTPEVFSWLPRIAVSPKDAREGVVLWQEIVFSGGSHGGEAYFARSVDGGASFSRPLNLSNSIGGDGKGSINRDVWHNGSLDLLPGADGTVFATWTEYDGQLWFSRSDDRGNSFTKPSLVAGGGNEKPARAPALALRADNTVYLAWTVGEDRGADIRLARSTNRGDNFSSASVVAHTKTYSDAPKIAVDAAGTLHMVHGESSGGPFGSYQVHYVRSRDGRVFEPGRVVSDPNVSGTTAAGYPSLAVDDNGTVVVSWELYEEQGERPRGLGMVVSRDAGKSFTKPAFVPNSRDASGGVNGSQQGMLMRKLALNNSGDIALVNSSFTPGEKSRVWLMRGKLKARQ